MRDLLRDREARDPFSQERLDNALAKKRAIYPEDAPPTKPVRNRGASIKQAGLGDTNQRNTRVEEVLQPGEENFGRTDEFEISHRIARPAGKKVEDMLARCLAWHYLKGFGLERPRVTTLRGKDSTAKIDVQKMGKERSIPKRQAAIPQSSRLLNVAQEPKIFKM